MNPTATHTLPIAPNRAAASRASTPRVASVPKRVVAATVAGNALEFKAFADLGQLFAR